MSVRHVSGGALRRIWPAVAPALLVLIATILVSALGDVVLRRVLVVALVNLILVVGLYIFVGNSGVFSFGHMSFMAVGAYTAGLLTLPSDDPLISTSLPGFLGGMHLASLPATVVGGAAAALLALVLSIPLMRLSGIAPALAMFAVLVIVNGVASNWASVTGATAGMAGVPITTNWIRALIWALLALVGAYLFQVSRVGLRLRASREDEVAARAIGIGIFNERRMAFVLSAFFVGIGGALYGQFVGSFNPGEFYLTITFLTIAMLVVGGMNSLAGAVIGTTVLSAVSEVLRRLEEGVSLGWVHIPQRVGLENLGLATIMLLILLLRPSGLTRGQEIAWPFRPPPERASGGGVSVSAEGASITAKPAPEEKARSLSAQTLRDDEGKEVRRVGR